MTDQLEADYIRFCEEVSDIYIHLPTIVGLVRDSNAQHVIELGTRTGLSTVAFLYGLRETGGRLTSIDLDERPDIGNYEHWSFIQGDDLDPEITSSLELADIVFIDTSHFYEQTLRELHVYRWLVKPGGVLLLHDTELPQPIGAPPIPEYPVKTAIDEFCDEVGLEWFNDPRCWGLGMIRIPGG